MAEGPAACPEDSVVGTEVYLIDTGFPEPNRIVTTDITFLNEKDGIIVVTRDRDSGARVVLHGKIGPETYDLDIPPQPGTPPRRRVEQARGRRLPHGHRSRGRVPDYAAELPRRGLLDLPRDLHVPRRGDGREGEPLAVPRRGDRAGHRA